MKAKKWVILLLGIIMIISIFYGCNQTQSENTNKNGSLFPGTIYDDIVLGETTVEELETILTKRGLDYEEWETSITDKFYEWDAYYFYMNVESFFEESESDYSYSDFLDEPVEYFQVLIGFEDDDGYREAAKLIQESIDNNLMDEYECEEGEFKYSIFKDIVTCYPVALVDINGTECIQYIMYGKMSHYNTSSEETKHLILVSMGVTPVEKYNEEGAPLLNNEEFEKIGTVTVEKVDIEIEMSEDYQSDTGLERDDEEKNYKNYALYLIDDNYHEFPKGNLRSCIIVSVREESAEIKLVNVASYTFLSLNSGTLNKCNASYGMNGTTGMQTTINNNLDVEIDRYIAFNYTYIQQFVDEIGGIWIDVNISQEERESLNTMTQSAKELLGCDELPVLENGYQKLSGMQAAYYCYMLSRTYAIEGNLEKQLDILNAVNTQLNTMSEDDRYDICNAYYDSLYTDISLDEFIEWAEYSDGYQIVEQACFPRKDMSKNATIAAKGSCIVPDTLESNVLWLHEFLYNDMAYEVPTSIKEYSLEIEGVLEIYGG